MTVNVQVILIIMNKRGEKGGGGEKLINCVEIISRLRIINYIIKSTSLSNKCMH